MSIALQSNGGDAIRRSRFIHGVPCVSIYDSSEPKVFAEDRRRLERESDSCSSSSIGRNSDLSGGSSDGEDSADDEVQSSFKGPLDTMDALEEVLPIKRGISKFYSGKSKSFTSLADASSVSSIKDFAKPENPYNNKKRKNLLAHASLWDKNHNQPLKNIGGGTSKRPASCNRSASVLCETLRSSATNVNRDDSSSISTSPSCNLPPLHPHGKRSPTIGSSSPPRQSPRRSFSLSDLQSVAASSTPNINGLIISGGDKNNELHRHF